MVGLIFLVFVITNADATLSREAVGPPSTNLHVGFRDAAVTEQQPQTEDGLGQNVKYGVGQNLAIDTSLASTVGEAPHTSR